MKEKCDVLIYASSKIRDLDGCVYLSLLLKKKGIRAKVVLHMNNLSAIIDFSPKIVVLQQVIEVQEINCARLAKKRGCCVVVNPVEGTYGTNAENKSFWGIPDEYDDLIDLYFAWGEAHKDLLTKYTSLNEKKIIITGPSRFDLHYKPLSDLYLSRSAFNKVLGINNPSSLNVLVTFNYIYADLTPKDLKKRPYCGHIPLSDLFKFQKSQRSLILSFICKLASKYSNVNFIIRPHPFEKRSEYLSFSKKIKSKNIFYSDALSDEPIYSTLKNIDILINVCSTTSTEGWLYNIPCISIIVDDNIKYDSYFLYGNEIVRNYSQLDALINYYINYGPIPDSILKNRTQFLKYWYNGAKGDSTGLCVTEIINYLSHHRIEVKSSISFPYIKEVFINSLKRVLGCKNHYPLRSIFDRDMRTQNLADLNIFTESVVESIETSINKIIT